MTGTDKPAVALFGASVRALAQSAAAAGFDVLACDLFSDEDLVECCRETVRLRLDEYPGGFGRPADRWPCVPRVYTGGLENHPEVVERFARTGPLWGCSPESLGACRRPTALRDCGVETPSVAFNPLGIPADGSWLAKPTKGSAGRGIRPWQGGALPPGLFLQQRVAGEPCSASFLALEERTVFLGAASQFVGEAWTGAPPFAYAGGIAPLALSPETTERLRQVGETLRSECSLRGLFGVDAVVEAGRWTFLEVNPRPTASMELFEFAGVASVFDLHRGAFAEKAIPPAWGAPATNERAAVVDGKAILYATEPCRLAEPLPPRAGDCSLADRPAAGTRFAPGDPVATVLARGSMAEQVRARLREGVAKFRDEYLRPC